MEKLIYCNDGCLAAMVARTNRSKRWDLFSVSVIHGMGNAEYNNKIFDFDFIEIVTLNSFSGKSHVGLNKDNKWGLLEVKDSETAHCEWNLIADFKYDDINFMLKEMNISKNEFE
jgi:hypothetical protein